VRRNYPLIGRLRYFFEKQVFSPVFVRRQPRPVDRDRRRQGCGAGQRGNRNLERENFRGETFFLLHHRERLGNRKHAEMLPIA